VTECPPCRTNLVVKRGKFAYRNGERILETRGISGLDLDQYTGIYYDEWLYRLGSGFYTHWAELPSYKYWLDPQEQPLPNGQAIWVASLRQGPHQGEFIGTRVAMDQKSDLAILVRGRVGRGQSWLEVQDHQVFRWYPIEPPPDVV